MNRREMFKAACAVVAVGSSSAFGAQRTRYGAMTVDRHASLCQQGVYLHVFYKGLDVTNRCRFADDTGEGMAELLIHNAAGRPHFDHHTRSLAQEIVYGVTFREGEPFNVK